MYSDTVTGASDEGRQEIALDEDEYEGDENTSDLGCQATISGADERLRNSSDSKDDTTSPDVLNVSTAANVIPSSIISKS